MSDDDNSSAKKTTHVDCEKLVNLLGDYVDNTLPADLKEAVDGHMHMCAPCMAFLRQYRFAPDAARKVLLTEVPQDLESRLLGFLKGRCKK